MGRVYRPFAFTLAIIFAACVRLLECLNLSGQQLTSIVANGNDSNGLPTAFTFYSNDTAVTEVTRKNLTTETSFSLRENELTTIPAELFQALTSTLFIDISNNPLTELEAESFTNLPVLIEITATNTKLKLLPSNLVSDCSALKTVVFNESYIHTIDHNAIANLPRLESILLAHNNVTTVYGDSLANLSRVHTLDLSYNNLTSVPNGLLTVAQSWKVLDFTRNNISTVPSKIKDAAVDGYISFKRNKFVEIEEKAFASASGIKELQLSGNGIFTVHSQAFTGMSSLRILDLSDNVISVVGDNAFAGLESLEELFLGANYIHRLTFTEFPPKLNRLELQENLLDQLPTFPENFVAPELQYLNLSHNVLWALETNSALTPYTSLLQLDLSWNQIVNFTSGVFNPILNTIEIMHFDYNMITSIPRTTFLSLIMNPDVNITLEANPGIGYTPDVANRSICPNGSVFESVSMPASKSPITMLYGCIQCKSGTYHDNSTDTCRSCEEVSSRAFADEDGAIVCKYCPYSSDLQSNREKCHDFVCSLYCWLTISSGLCIPGLIFSSKLLLHLLTRTIARQRRINLKEQEELTAWRVEEVMRQLGGNSLGTSVNNDSDDNDTDEVMAPCRIYDLPQETKEMVLEALQDHFELRKQKMKLSLAPDEVQRANQWDNVEWETFHMHRILSRNYHGEIFLGDYCGSQVVVKRLMTLRYEVKELANAIRDIEHMLQFRHPRIVDYLGTMWTAKEHLCVITEHVRMGDLHSILEMEAMNHAASASSALIASDASIFTQISSFRDHSLSPTTVAAQAKLQMMQDVCSALAYVHDQGLTHGDLRSRNILVTDEFRCKVSDFRPFSRNEKYLGTTIHLAPHASHDGEIGSDGELNEFIDLKGVTFLETSHDGNLDSINRKPSLSLSLFAPEVLTRHPRHYASDIYSFGVILLEMWFYRYITFQTKSLDEVERKSVRGNGAQDDESAPKESLDGINSPSRDEFHHVQRRSSNARKTAALHNERVQAFVEKLRSNPSMELDDNDRSFGTVTSSSSATASLVSAGVVVEKLYTTIEECLQYDPKKRPTAKMLVKLFQQLLDELSVGSG